KKQTDELENQTRLATKQKQKAVKLANFAEKKRLLAEQKTHDEKKARGEAEKRKKQAITALGEKSKALGEKVKALAERDKALVEARVRLYHSQFALAERRWQEGDVRQALRVLQECPAEFRGWEWGYLKRLCQSELLDIPGQGRSQVTFTRSGRHLIVSTNLPDFGMRGPIRHPVTSIWSWYTGKRILDALPDADYLLSE